MKKIFYFIFVTICVILIFTYSIISSGKTLNYKEYNSQVLSEELSNSEMDIDCCNHCSGSYCGKFISEGNDTITLYYK